MNNYDKKILTMLDELKSSGNNHIIAFSGGSDEEESIDAIVAESMAELQNYRIAILTGGTSWGLPRIASDYAQRAGLPTIGVYPSRGSTYVLPQLDYAIEIPPHYGQSEWGDESELFAKLSEGVIVIGGGMGTAIEFAHIMKLNEARVKREQNPIYIAPVMQGSSSFADLTYRLPIKLEVRNQCMPQQQPKTGATAAQYLIEKLMLPCRNPICQT